MIYTNTVIAKRVVMYTITIAIGADHRGYELKKYLMENVAHCIENLQISWIDVGAYNDERSDYPKFAISVCNHMRDGTASVGVLICGTGVGMAITANRFDGIYAGVAWNEEIARLSREDDNINVLVLPADYVTQDVALAAFIAWLSTPFNHGRYATRIAMIDEIHTDKKS